MTRKRHVAARFTPESRARKTLRLTGNVWLRHVDHAEDVTLSAGDIALYLSTERDDRVPEGHYEMTGYSGYFKAEVYDGGRWHLLGLDDFFPDREHHFRKHERPIDTYAICRPLLAAFAGREVVRTYREHYELAE